VMWHLNTEGSESAPTHPGQRGPRRSYARGGSFLRKASMLRPYEEKLSLQIRIQKVRSNRANSVRCG